MNRQAAIDAIRNSRLARHADSLIERLEPSVRLIVDEGPAAAPVEAAGSHFGGLPSLPAAADWPLWDKHDFLQAQIARSEEAFKKNPRATLFRDMAAKLRLQLSDGPRPLAFLGQLSLSELHQAAPLPAWPCEGLLSFFYDESEDAGFDPLARGCCRVLYFPEGLRVAVTPIPAGLPEEGVFPERRLSFVREWSLPSRIMLGEECLTIWDDAYRELAGQLMPGLTSDDVQDPLHAIHRCGGHPQEIQGDMRLECQLVSNGIYCGDPSGYKDPRRASLESGAADWELLIQIDSDADRLGWMWGDMGRLYFWNRRQDLAAANFEGAWAILQGY